MILSNNTEILKGYETASPLLRESGYADPSAMGQKRADDTDGAAAVRAAEDKIAGSRWRDQRDGKARSYCEGQTDSLTPNARAARYAQNGSDNSARARNTRSA